MAKSNRRGQATVLTREQVQQVCRELDYPHRAIAQLCYLTGSRVGEIISLKAADIVSGELIISMPKTSKVKAIAITPEIKAVLGAANLPSSGYLFPSKNSQGYLTTRGFEKRLAAAFELLGIEGASTHSFRRSAATHAYETTNSLAKVQRLTGHASLGSLSLYIDIDRAEADAAIASTFAGMFA